MGPTALSGPMLLSVNNDVFISFGQGMMKAGGKIMNLALYFWKELATISRDFLKQNPLTITFSTSPSGIGGETANFYQSLISTAFNVALAAGISLAILYFFVGMIQESAELKYLFGMEPITKMFLRLVIVVFLVESSYQIAIDITSICITAMSSISVTVDEMASTKSVAEATGNYERVKASEVNPDSPLYSEWYTTFTGDSPGYVYLTNNPGAVLGSAIMHANLNGDKGSAENKRRFARYVNSLAEKDAADYGYFVTVYNDMQQQTWREQAMASPPRAYGEGDTDTMSSTGEDTEKLSKEYYAEDWLLMGLLCLVTGAVGGIGILAASVSILKTVVTRMFKLLVSLPFAPLSFASLAKGPQEMDRAMGWARTFLAFCLEALVVTIALKISITMFGRYKLQESGASIMEKAVADIVNLCLPLLSGAACIKVADEIVAKCLGI